MRTIQVIMGVAIVVFIILLFAGSPRQRAPRYNVATEASVRGVVEQIQEFYCPISGDEGTHLLVRTESGTIQVHVAPRRFLQSNHFSFAKGDQIEVVGSQVSYQGAPAVIAREITRGDETFAFRTQSGRPVWAE